MKTFTNQEIKALEHIYKINLVNSITGYKPANLVGTISNTGNTNVAVFSSVIHLGSSPALLGMVFRPTTVARNTYDNIKENGCYTLNHIHQEIIEDAHHTSAKYPSEISEFEMTGLQEEYKPNCPSPFAQGAPVQIEMKYVNEYAIQENGTILLIGSVEKVHIQESLIEKDGFVNLSKGKVVAINGLDGYIKTESVERQSYQRPKKSTIQI